MRESHWEEDADDKSIPIIIGDGNQEMSDWFPDRHTIFTTAKTASMYKLSRNAMLAAKVTLANYIQRVCQEYDTDYIDVAQLLKEHANLGTSQWDLPGPDGDYGFGGSCFPKDTTHLASLTGGHNIFDYVLRCNERDR